ncbi:hypothetical protein [Bradyrhizobium genosp. P]|uniref:hypothetical protein n=1 Tax=Bradyrhizobium genosp. P TaxID=83641 RepID=UPI003CF000C5
MAGIDRSDTAADHQPPLISLSAANDDGSKPEEKITRSLAQVDDGTPASFGVFQEKLSTTQTKLKDFATGTELSAVATLIVRLNSDFRKSAREDLWAAVSTDVAAQEAAAKALRDSGLCQMIGAILTSSGAIAGAFMNLRGARQSQVKFNEQLTTKIEGTLPKSDLKPELSNKPAGQPPRLAAVEDAPQDIARQDRTAKRGGGDVTPHSSEIESSSESDAPSASAENDVQPHDTTGPLQFTRIAMAQTAAQREIMKWGGLGTITSETTKILAAGVNMGATHFQEEKAERDADSTKAKAQTDSEKQFIEYYQTVIQDLLGKLAELRSADSETRSKLVNMA